jgi:hypothetical protein
VRPGVECDHQGTDVYKQNRAFLFSFAFKSIIEQLQLVERVVGANHRSWWNAHPEHQCCIALKIIANRDYFHTSLMNFLIYHERTETAWRQLLKS